MKNKKERIFWKKWSKPNVKTIIAKELAEYIKVAAWSGPIDGGCFGHGR